MSKDAYGELKSGQVYAPELRHRADQRRHQHILDHPLHRRRHRRRGWVWWQGLMDSARHIMRNTDASACIRRLQSFALAPVLATS